MDCGWRLSAVRILGFSGRNCRTGGRRTATSFCPRRATEGREERQHLFVHGGPRRGAENGNTFLSTKGHEGPRRTATSFCPRRAMEGRGERQHLFVHGGPRRGAENGNIFLSTEGHGGARRTATPFCPRRGAENGNTFLSTEGHGGPRRTATPFCPRRATEGRGERQHLFVHGGPRRAAKNGNIFLSTEGHEGPRRTATSFFPRRDAKNIDGSCPTEGRRVLKRAPTRGAPTGGVWGIWESTPGAREGRHKACPYGGGAVLPRFFCSLGVGSVWGKMFLLLRSILIYWRKQRVHIV